MPQKSYSSNTMNKVFSMLLTATNLTSEFKRTTLGQGQGAQLLFNLESLPKTIQQAVVKPSCLTCPHYNLRQLAVKNFLVVFILLSKLRICIKCQFLHGTQTLSSVHFCTEIRNNNMCPSAFCFRQNTLQLSCSEENFFFIG